MNKLSPTIKIEDHHSLGGSLNLIPPPAFIIMWAGA